MAALYVSVDDTVTVEMFKTLAYLLRNCCNLTLAHQIGCDDIRETSALHVLHNYPELVRVQERVDIVHDVGVTRSSHCENPANGQVLPRLLVKIHLLDCNNQIAASLVGGVNASRCTI